MCLSHPLLWDGVTPIFRKGDMKFPTTIAILLLSSIVTLCHCCTSRRGKQKAQTDSIFREGNITHNLLFPLCIHIESTNCAVTTTRDQCSPIGKLLPQDCPSFKFYESGTVDKSTPSFLLSISSLDEAIGRLIELTGGGSDHTVSDTLSGLLRQTSWDYNEVADGLKWKDSTQLLPLQSVCNSLTVSQQSELSIQFRHHVGLSLTDSNTVEDFLLSAYSVRMIGPCTLYDEEKVLLAASNFITRLDFLRNAQFRPEFLANVVLEMKNRYYNVLEWYPKVIARTKLLFHPTSASNYYRYLANGAIQFKHNNCTLRMIAKEKLEQQIRKNPNKYTAQILHDFHNNLGPRPPYLLVKNTPIKYWKRKFGDKALEIRQTMLTSYMEHSALSTSESIKLAILIKNKQLSKSSPGEFELVLKSVTAANQLEKYHYSPNVTVVAPILPDRTVRSGAGNISDSLKPHIRRKRHPILLFFQTAIRLITQVGQRLITFFRGWSGTVIGSNLGRSLQKVYSNLQGAAKGWSSQIRTHHSVRQILGKMGPAQKALTPYVRLRSPGSLPLPAKQLKFGPGRYSSLQLPAPLNRQLSLFSPERLQLKQRLVNFYAWSKRNAILIGSTAATAALFGFSVDATANEKYQTSNEYATNPSFDGPHVYQAAQNWQSIANGTHFIYQPITMTREQGQSLQIDVYGSANGTQGNKTLADLYDSALHVAYDNDVISIYDLSLPVELRREALLKLRHKNQLLREIDSMTFAAAKYSQKSPLHEKAMIAAEVFIGICQTGHTSLLPTDEFMDSMLRNLVASGNLQAFIDEVMQYRNLVFIQLQDNWTQETRNTFIHAAEGIQGQFTADQLDQFDESVDPEAKQVFTLILRKSGRDHLHNYNHLMDLLLSAEQERRFWQRSYGSHRLLYTNPPTEMPNSQSDYLSTLFFFQMYFTEDGRMDQVDAFIDAMGRLTLIRLYDENRAVGLSTASLEEQISPLDLAILKQSGLKGIASSQPPDASTFSDYDQLSSLANANTTLVEFSPSLSDYEEDYAEGGKILRNELTGLNHIYNTEEGRNKRRKRRDLQQEEERKLLAERAIHRILGNISTDDGVKAELQLLTKDPTRSLLLMEQTKRSQGQLNLLDMLKLEEHLADRSKARGASMNDLKKMHNDFLASALNYLGTHEIPGEMMALLLSPQQSSDLPEVTRAQLLTANRVLRIKPLSSLLERQALLNYLRSLDLEQHDVTLKIQGLENVAIFLALVLLLLIGNAALLYALCTRKNTPPKKAEEGEKEEMYALHKQ